jgi:hypothetical protein
MRLGKSTFSKSRLHGCVAGIRVLAVLALLCAIAAGPAYPQDGEDSAVPLFEKLLRVPRQVQVLQTSSHGKQGYNNDHNWPQYVDKNGEEVLLDVKGPGCVKSMWGTFFDKNGIIRFYFDGETTPRYQGGIVDFYQGALPEFPRPLVSYERRGHGNEGFAGNSFVPIPFEKSLKITVQGRSEFYHILYETYPAGTKMPSFTSREDRSALLDAFAGDVRINETGLKRVEFTMKDAFDAGQVAVVYSAKETSGIIRELTLETDGSEDFLQQCWIRMKWDSAPRFQVMAPIGIFFGSAVRANDMRSLPLDMEKLDDGRVRLRCRFPMPFWQNAEIALVNRTGLKKGPVKATLLVGPNPVSMEEGTYFTTMYHEGQTVYGHDWLLFEGAGSGWYVGTVQSMQYEHYCEGDEHFYIDGAISPQINGTGSEDYYLACFWPNQDFDMPFACVVGNIFVEGGGFYKGSYNVPSSYSRYHLEAPIPFYSGITAKIQHGGLSDILSRYRSLSFVYLDRRVRLKQTDFLDVGNAQSEKAHKYEFTGKTTVRTVQSHPEGDFFETFWTEEGRYHEGGEIRFVVAVDPNNDGVRLRRRLDQEVPCQGAKVFVDGTYAGTWYWGYRNEYLRWYDQDFDLAGDLTAGKSALALRLELLPQTNIQVPESSARPSAKLLYPAVRYTDLSYTVFCFE